MRATVQALIAVFTMVLTACYFTHKRFILQLCHLLSAGFVVMFSEHEGIAVSNTVFGAISCSQYDYVLTCDKTALQDNRHAIRVPPC